MTQRDKDRIDYLQGQVDAEGVFSVYAIIGTRKKITLAEFSNLVCDKHFGVKSIAWNEGYVNMMENLHEMTELLE